MRTRKMIRERSAIASNFSVGSIEQPGMIGEIFALAHPCSVRFRI